MEHFLPVMTSKAYGKSPENDILWSDPLVQIIATDQTVRTIQQRGNYSTSDVVKEIYYFLEHYCPRAVSNMVDDRVIGQYERALNTIEKKIKERYHVLRDRDEYHRRRKLFTDLHDPPKVHGIRRSAIDKRTPFMGAQTCDSRLQDSRLQNSRLQTIPLSTSMNIDNYHPGLRQPAVMARYTDDMTTTKLYTRHIPLELHRMSNRRQSLWI
jgi:hypothetical protein